MENYIHELTMKVRDYECDLQGIVNNANYQHYLEHARHEFLLGTGTSFAALHEQGIDAVVARISMAFKTPLKSGDEFVCLSGQVDALTASVRRFESTVARTAQTLDFPFSVSIGYATFDPQTDHRLPDVMHRCDEMLYLNKEKKAQFVMPEDFSTVSGVSVD